MKMTGILLAGGQSKRMGQEKGNIKLPGARLYEYPLSVLESLCDEILLSSNEDKLTGNKYRILCDEVEGIGPVGGLYTCLKASSHDLNLVLSYDMPLASRSLFEYLLQEWKEEEVLIPADGLGRPEPLCGLYRLSALDALKEMIRQKDYAVQGILRRTRSRVLKITKAHACWHQDLFLNINREADLSIIPPDLDLTRND